MGIETSNLGGADNKNESQKSIEKNMDDFGYGESKEHSKHMFLSLSKEGPEAVANFRKQCVLAWQNADQRLYEFYATFRYHSDSDEKLKKEYAFIINARQHTDPYYLGSIYSALQSIGARDGFSDQERQPKEYIASTIEILKKLEKMNLIGPNSEEAKRNKALKEKYPPNPLPPDYFKNEK